MFAEIIDALGGMTDETKRDAIAMALMGRSAQELNPLILAGGDALRTYGEEAKEKMGAMIGEGAIMQLGNVAGRTRQNHSGHRS